MVKDSTALSRILDDAFVCVASDGKLLTKAEVMADVNTSTALQILPESMVVHLHGDTAIVTGTFRTKAWNAGSRMREGSVSASGESSAFQSMWNESKVL
jgi:hypothetical protein